MFAAKNICDPEAYTYPVNISRTQKRFNIKTLVQLIYKTFTLTFVEHYPLFIQSAIAEYLLHDIPISSPYPLCYSTLREKAELEQMIVDGVSKLKASITALHRRLCADANLSERTRTTLTLNGAADERKNIDILINKIIQIEESADLLEEKNRELGM